MRLIGIVGSAGAKSSAGAGKSTVASYLVKRHGWCAESFAGSLKDAVSSIFGWDRELLEGSTETSRTWRNKTDLWWSVRLRIPNLTPRWVLQNFGTEACREHFHNDIWIASMQRRLLDKSKDTVIADVRFPNELAMIHALGGVIVCVVRNIDAAAVADAFTTHSSETALLDAKVDFIIENDGTLEDLYKDVDEMISVMKDNVI